LFFNGFQFVMVNFVIGELFPEPPLIRLGVETADDVVAEW
jgi:hypothetical protein